MKEREVKNYKYKGYDLVKRDGKWYIWIRKGLNMWDKGFDRLGALMQAIDDGKVPPNWREKLDSMLDYSHRMDPGANDLAARPRNVQ